MCQKGVATKKGPYYEHLTSTGLCPCNDYVKAFHIYVQENGSMKKYLNPNIIQFPFAVY